LNVSGAGYFTLAVLTVLLIPIMVLPLEGRRAPSLLYGAIAVGGLAASLWSGGMVGFAWAIAMALAVMVIVGGGVTLLRAATRLRILTGGQIKLMAAGATWLGPLGTVLMIAIAIIALFAIAGWRQLRDTRQRPESAIVVAAAIMIVALQQNIPLI
jgi:prepilin signal peptidase PulO-like enzyme (type II secretory pathway)